MFSVEDLPGLLASAAREGASSVLLLAGAPPAARIAGQLKNELLPTPLNFYETQAIAESLLSPQLLQELNELGSVEAPYSLGVTAGRVTVFYGLGCHNLVFYFETVQ